MIYVMDGVGWWREGDMGEFPSFKCGFPKL